MKFNATRYISSSTQPSSTTPPWGNTCDTRFIIHRGIRLSYPANIRADLLLVSLWKMQVSSLRIRNHLTITFYLAKKKELGQAFEKFRLFSLSLSLSSFLSLSTFPYTSASIHFVSVTRKVAARKRLFFGNETTYGACARVCDDSYCFVRTWIREGRYVGSNKRGE